MEDLVTLGFSLGVGLLVGLQRERTASRLGGIRTFPLISLLGTFTAFMAVAYGAWVIVGGFLCIFGVMAVSNFLQVHREGAEPGQTTEIAALLTFAIGAYLVGGERIVALVAAGVVVVLLHAKTPLHRFVEKMGHQDVTAIMQFVVIALIILPLLPDRAYGPYRVLNPFDIWRMVVLIVAISLGGYIAYKMLGQKVGTLLGGILGGMISSTATTVSYSRRTRSAPEAHNLAIIAILIASGIAYGRVILEISIIAPGHVYRLIPPMTAMLLWMFVISAGAYLRFRPGREEVPQPSNPAELKSAIIFGLIYAAVLLAVAAVRQHFGNTALYAVAVVSGLTDMDAITLSIARMVQSNRLDGGEGWRLVLVASLTNLVFKWGAAAFLGGWRFGLRLGIFFGFGITGGLALLWLWP